MLGDPAALREIVKAIAAQLVPAADAVRRACDSLPTHLAPVAARPPSTPSARPTAFRSRTTPLRRLLALEVAQLALGGEPIVEQRVDLIQVSADAGNGLDPRERAEDKLAGLQLAHFGAFYKRSWRANDWMWGRHDAVQRLVQVLLDPARLRQLGFGARAPSRRSSGSPSKGWRRTRSSCAGSAASLERGEATDELIFLDHPVTPPPATLPMCAQAIARRLQFRILQEELRQSARRSAATRTTAPPMSTAARYFRDEYVRRRTRCPPRTPWPCSRPARSARSRSATRPPPTSSPARPRRRSR